MKRLMSLLCLMTALVLTGCPDQKKDTPSEKKSGEAVENKNKGDKGDAFLKLKYEEALAKAKDTKKVVMIDFNATWCPPCRELEKVTFKNEKVQKLLKDKTVAIKVDVDDDPKLAGKYKVEGIPCIVFISPEGKEVGRMVGFSEPEVFMDKVSAFTK